MDSQNPKLYSENILRTVCKKVNRDQSLCNSTLNSIDPLPIHALQQVRFQFRQGKEELNHVFLKLRFQVTSSRKRDNIIEKTLRVGQRFKTRFTPEQYDPYDEYSVHNVRNN